MKVYEGDLVEGGVSTPDGWWKRYSYLKIGTTQLNNIRITPRLDRVLHGQIDRGSVKLWVARWMFCDIIIGITQADGQTFRQSLALFNMQLYFSAAIVIICLFAVLTGHPVAFIPALIFITIGLIPFNFIRKVKQIKSEHSI
ncbi:TPA: hypothetical protein QDB15_005694 [Burkholderia vietnamiensis]|nr:MULTISPECIES: hypothetical protein [Burkholderia]MCA8147082.1 hypothetical protein [Burkholderia vietnamiensis]MCA8211591.1 hypothetical protein [Burkholderia vietnamiensis]HDR8943312.1 hypothetical protein [Burkholderia vietnamiensis]HDR9101088.1 hypothetical protein [Burkholderia vietnamiensis]HDR9121837.1 hypothetical protein [Burkholderia vietnamiensis]